MEMQNFSVEGLARILEDKYKYYSDEMLQYRTFLGLVNFMRPDENDAQKVYTICLEGAPGVGKTMFAKVYSKLVTDLYGGETVFVDFTCNIDTGKTELVEEINVSALAKHDNDNIDIPGKIIEAIKAVNEGKRVILFVDEYDKARRSTDSFFNSFLQSGNLNAVQHGDVYIKPEYINNIQVIFCKNDPEVELSEAMQRRVKIIRLDYITPERFYTIAKRSLIDEREEGRKVDEGLLNLVAFIYAKVYEKKDKLYSRVPATSELLIAIEEADILLRKANAEGNVIYQLLMEDIFKDPDNRTAFESALKSKSTESDKKFIKVLEDMKKAGNTETNKMNLNDIIAANMFDGIETEAVEKIKYAMELVKKYDQLVAEETSRMANSAPADKEGPTKVDACGVSFDVAYVPNNVLPNFQDETEFLKRGKSSMGGKDEWINIAQAVCTEKADPFILEKLIRSASRCNIEVYEDGFRFKNNTGVKVSMIRTCENELYVYTIYSNSLVIPASLLNNVYSAFDIVSELSKKGEIRYSVNALVYNEIDMPDLDKTNEDNVYLLNTTDKEVLPKLAIRESISDYSLLKDIHKKFMSLEEGQSKQLTK